MIAYLLLVVAIIVIALLFVVVWRQHSQVVAAHQTQQRRDAQQRQHTNEAVDNETRLRLSFDAIPQGVVVAGVDGGELYRNSYAQAFTEARHGEALVEIAISELAAEAVQGKAVEREVELFGPPRTCYFVSAKPLQLNATTYGAVALIDDVTELQRLDTMRRDFVANISHELRTPMGALCLLAETLADESDPQVVSRLAARIQTEAMRLSDMMNELLELSQIESAEMVNQTLIDIQHVIDEALLRVAQAARDKRVTIELSLPAIGCKVPGDLRQLTSAVFNLLDNAVKCSEPKCQVWVSVVVSEGWVEVEVRDQGHGIAESHQQRIFERFYQVDRSRADNAGQGVGLGLAIVRHVVNNHGGEVVVSSDLGQGATFTLRLPMSSELVGATT